MKAWAGLYNRLPARLCRPRGVVGTNWAKLVDSLGEASQRQPPNDNSAAAIAEHAPPMAQWRVKAEINVSMPTISPIRHVPSQARICPAKRMSLSLETADE